mgnify:CR=1 FL=1
MKAQYSSTCNACWIPISPGNRVQKHDTKGYVHSSCHASLLRAEVRRKEAAKAKAQSEQLSLFK